jgi:serine/threonine protein kinase
LNTPSHQLPPGTILKGKYRVLQVVGGGAMAWVYQVEEIQSGGQAIRALKELRLLSKDQGSETEALRLFEQEARILSNLAHPNLPRVSDFFEEESKSYLVMEFIEGHSLQKHLEMKGALLENDVLNWAIQLCHVLDYLHSQTPPIIFRDLKPSNVMLTSQGVIKLIDFGIARTYKVGKKRDTMAMGSENYAAREQWGKGQTDARSDIYSLGATMYHLLSNMPPSPAFLPSLPLPLHSYNPAISTKTENVIKKAVARDSQQRYQSATEMEAALLDCLTVPSVDPGASPYTIPQPPTSPPKICPACQCSNKSGAKFCIGCGHSFVGALPAVLRFVQPAGVNWEMPIQRTPLLIGRRSDPEGFCPDFDLSFYDPHGYVSRRQAQITRSGGKYLIIDLGGSNTTAVNRIKLTPQVPQELRNGDQIKVGKIVLKFHLS